MSVKVTDNTVQIKIDTQNKTGMFLRLLLEDVDTNASRITPRDQGFLHNSTQKTVLGKRGTIKWLKKYASPQEAGIVGKGHPVRRYTTPGTGAHYAERSAMKSVINAGAIMKRAGIV